MPHKEASSISWIIVEMASPCWLSVSYTHLDVYKRQGVYGGVSEEEKGTGVGEIVGGTLTAVYAKNLILKKAGLEETLSLIHIL